MADTLEEDQCYGLSSRRLNHGANISIFHVKLTDSAARAFDNYEDNKGLPAQPSICFTGNQGKITLPSTDTESAVELRTFTFYLTNIGRDNPQCSFDLIHNHSTSDDEAQLSCVGVIQRKLTVNATDESYCKALQSLTQAEEETRSKGAIVIKPGGRYLGKKGKIRAPPSALTDIATSRLSSRPVLVTSSRRKGVSVSKPKSLSEGTGVVVSVQRPLRERLTHLLGLRPYRRPELLLRLQKDGLTERDKDMLDTLLLQVGQLNSRDNTYTLKEDLYKELQKDWGGYTTGDQQLLKRILVKRLFQPQNLLSVPETQVSPLRDTPNSSPAQKYSIAEEYTDPLANKKPRISHLSSKATNGKQGTSLSNRKEAGHGVQVTIATKVDSSVTSSDSKLPFDPPSRVMTQEEQAPSGELGSGGSAPRLPPSRGGSRPSRKSRHREGDERLGGRDKGRGGAKTLSLKHKEHNGMFFNPSVLPANDMTDYLLKYTVICNQDQRQRYKQDFNKEYKDYLDLHSRIDCVTRQFTELDTQLKQLRHGTHKYQTLHNQIVQEYRKIKKSNPNYKQDRRRCEYLHNKLAHIKRLISKHDQRQLKN
ncbi:RNA polymerase II elongation factor ELL-like [Osmerus mordax]|uniref:RNA polymerase II elongation factor ELL-like n=1 Tax=Osmerus mordax TaxID=8014 RepID=UPI00350EDDA5